MPVAFLGRPVAHWLFGLRTWAAMMLALYVAFWLQIDGAASAILTAAVLAQPARGQALSKAVGRFAGTVLGVAASVAIAGLFSDVRTLFLVAVAAWLAACVFIGNMFDGNRAYAAVLSGYTVAIVAVAHIDQPSAVFSSGVDRGAAIAVGIAATALVADLLGEPNLLPGFLKRIRAVHGDVRIFALDVLERGTARPLDVARLLSRITALRADALLLPRESVAGRARAAAARRAIAELVREARAARIMAATLAAAGEDGPLWRGRVAEALDGGAAAERLAAQAAALLAADDTGPQHLIAARSSGAVLRRDRCVVEAIRTLEAGGGPGRGPRLRRYHSRRGAARNALRTFLTVLGSSALLVVLGLPSSSTVLLYVCLLSALSTNAPDPWRFAVSALTGIPLAAAAAGVTEFLVLGGADDFTLLAVALLPTVVAGGLLMASGKPSLAPIGLVLVVFTPNLMSLANPQAYDPSTYLNAVAFMMTAALLLAASVLALLPTDDLRRRGWMLGAARRELFDVVAGRRDRRTLEEASFRAADRLGQLAALAYRDERERDAVLAHALRLSEVTFSARRLREALHGLGGDPAVEARRALATLDSASLRGAAARLRAEAAWRWAGATAARTAALIESHAADLALARAGRTP